MKMDRTESRYSLSSMSSILSILHEFCIRILFVYNMIFIDGVWGLGSAKH